MNINETISLREFKRQVQRLAHTIGENHSSVRCEIHTDGDITFEAFIYHLGLYKSGTPNEVISLLMDAITEKYDKQEDEFDITV